MDKARKKAESHFTFLAKVLRQYGEEPSDVEKFWFIEGFIHGFKHGKEERSKTK